MALEYYRIKSKVEECDCDYCASPLYVGDRVALLDENDVVCGARCAAKLKQFRAKRRAPQVASEDARQRPLFGDIVEPVAKPRQLDIFEPELFDRASAALKAGKRE